MTTIDWNQRADYAQAVISATKTVHNGAIFPTWIGNDHFWYEREGDDGAEFAVVSAASGERNATLARATIAKALAAHLDAPVDAEGLIVRDPIFDLDGGVLHFSAYGEAYAYDWTKDTLTPGQTKASSNWVGAADLRG